MIGSENGYVIVDFKIPQFLIETVKDPFESRFAHVLKLNVHFDILSISSLENGWIIGGPAGQLAISHYTLGPINLPYIPEWSMDDLTEFAGSWKTVQLPVKDSVVRLESIGDTIVALAGEKLHWSSDNGENWQSVTHLTGVRDLEAFKGSFYAFNKVKVGYDWNLHLLKSTDGMTWETVWTIEDFDASEMTLRPLAELVDGENRPFMEAMRLNVTARYFWHMGPYTDRTNSLSSTDGLTWQDTGSYHYSVGREIGSNSRKILNPLNLPETHLYLPRPKTQPNPHSRNYTVADNKLLRYEANGWTTVMQTTPEERPHQVLAAAWGDLVFMSDTAQLAILGADGEWQLTGGPVYQNWLQLTATNNGYYALWGGLYSVGYDVLYSRDLESWEEIDTTEDRPQIWDIKTDGKDAVMFYGIRKPEHGIRPGPYEEEARALLVLGDPEAEPLIMPPNRKDVTYLPGTNKWYALWHNAPGNSDDSRVYIDQLDFAGEAKVFTSFTPEVWNGYYTRLDAPDGNRLIAYGDSAELAIVSPDGSVQLVHPWRYFPADGYRIDTIRFVNGWYYLIGDVTVRTQDFESFERFEGPPVESPITDVIGYGTDLFVIAGAHVFKQPLELGYLDSILRKQGWRQSSWLGWFRIINEGEGLIEHLLLGNCTVEHVSGTQFSINTEALGQLSVRSDWMPWCQNISNGHWYWLDQASWPPRAWDADAGVWVELKP